MSGALHRHVRSRVGPRCAVFESSWLFLLVYRSPSRRHSRLGVPDLSTSLDTHSPRKEFSDVQLPENIVGTDGIEPPTPGFSRLIPPGDYWPLCDRMGGDPGFFEPGIPAARWSRFLLDSSETKLTQYLERCPSLVRFRIKHACLSRQPGSVSVHPQRKTPGEKHTLACENRSAQS